MQNCSFSAAIYPRFHIHLLSKLVPKLKSRKSSIIVLFESKLFNLFINEYFVKIQPY